MHTYIHIYIHTYIYIYMTAPPGRLLAARDGTAPPSRLRASTSGWDSAVVREPSFDFSGAAPQKFVAVDGLSIQVMASNLSALGYEKFDKEWHGR